MSSTVEQRPPSGAVDFGHLRRLQPISDCFGYDRGQPIDRYYIENFLGHEAAAVRGRALEIGDNAYTRRFGGTRVEVSDVLHAVKGNPNATIVADLTHADNISSDLFDCIILTQTLQYVYELPRAIRTLRRILKPGGTVLATVPGISQRDQGDWPWYWTFSSQSIQRLFGEVFGPDHVQVQAHGNVLVALAFLHGLAAEELTPAELDHHDRLYEVLITVRADKAA